MCWSSCSDSAIVCVMTTRPPVLNSVLRRLNVTRSRPLTHRLFWVWSLQQPGGNPVEDPQTDGSWCASATTPRANPLTTSRRFTSGPIDTVLRSIADGRWRGTRKYESDLISGCRLRTSGLCLQAVGASDFSLG